MSEKSCGTGCGCAAGAKSEVSTTASAPAKTGIQNGKGSAPRNISKTFLKNYEGIRWTERGKKRQEGKKFVKVY